MKKIKVVQIGIGHDHGAAAWIAMKNRAEVFDLVGYVIPEGEEKYAEKHAKHLEGFPRLTLEEALAIPELHAAVVETEEKSLTYYAQKAVERGLHVHMDKPGSENTEQFENLFKCAKQQNTVLHMGYMYRYNPAVKKLMEDIKLGKLGEIYCVEAQMSCWHKTEKRQWLDQFAGGMMFYLGCHLVDLMLQIQGTPEEVIPLNTAVGIDGTTSKDYGMAVFRYPHGVSFVKACAAEVGGYTRRQFVVCGSKGTVELKPFEDYATGEGMQLPLYTGVAEVYDSDTAGKGWRDCRTLSKTATYDRYDEMMLSFAAMVRGEKKNPYSYEYEVLLHRTLMKACGKDVAYQDPIVLD